MSRSPQLKLPVGDQDHIQGAADARVTLVEYGDYECPHCGAAYPLIKRVQARLGGQMRFAFRNFPLAEMHPHATAAAEMAEAAALQGKFWPMHDTLFEHQNGLSTHHMLEYAKALGLDAAKLKDALASGAPGERVRADFLGGVKSGVNGTPTFYINEQRFDGDWTNENEFAEALQAASKR